MQTETDLLDSLTDSQLLDVEQLATKCLIEGATLADVWGYTADEMEAVYHFAHQAYRQRKYDDALKLFQFLVQNDHTENRFWMGLAASHQLSGNHEQAVTAYGMAAVLDATNPRPALHACECYLAREDWANGRKALEAVNLLCGLPGAEPYADVQKRAGLLSAIIDKADPETNGKAADG